MRTHLVILAILVAGCSGPSEAPTADPDPSEAPPTNETNATAFASPVELLAQTVEWNEVQTSPFPAAFGAIYLGAQTFRPACIDTSDQPDEWSALIIDLYRPVPEGTGNLSVTLDWDDATYMRDEMVVAYKPPGEAWTEGPYQARGEATQIPVFPDHWDDGRETEWEMAVCLTRDDEHIPDDTSYRPGPAKGPMDIRIEALA